MGDFESVISTPTGYPYQQIFYNATRSRGGATAMSCIIVLAAVANGMTNMATASRQLFAFARDEGVPFHRWFATVPAGWAIPLNGMFLTSHRVHSLTMYSCPFHGLLLLRSITCQHRLDLRL